MLPKASQATSSSIIGSQVNLLGAPLDELLENINSKADFLNFIQALSNDRLDEVKKEKINPSSPYGSGTNGWENGSIESFLEAVSRYGQDSKSISETPNWKEFAQLLYAGKFYE